jgi:hypothetical protein
MFTAKMPLLFVARASLDSTKLAFRTSMILLRYCSIENEVMRTPRFVLQDCDPQDPGSEVNGPWIIGERAPIGGSRIFELMFCGSQMNQLMAANPAHPLLSAFLDQETIELPLRLGPILQAPGAPERADRQLTVSVFLRLAVQITPMPPMPG